MNTGICGTGHGKLIFFGEHSAVYGYPAAGTPLPCRTTLEWKPEGKTNGIPQTPDEIGKDRETFLSLLEYAWAEFPGILPYGGTWLRRGNVPRTGGFGSSAALCVALARIMLRQNSSEYNREVHNVANKLESRFHGTPSGIDTGMACDNTAAAWRKSEGGDTNAIRRPLSIPAWPLIYGALPRIASTSVSVGSLARKRMKKDPQTMNWMEDLGRISENFIDWESKIVRDCHTFTQFAAELANSAQEVLLKLGLSTPEMELLFSEARAMGAPGCKMSGAGMGGAFFICAEDLAQRKRLLEALPERLRKIGIVLEHPLTALDISRD